MNNGSNNSMEVNVSRGDGIENSMVLIEEPDLLEIIMRVVTGVAMVEFKMIGRQEIRVTGMAVPKVGGKMVARSRGIGEVLEVTGVVDLKLRIGKGMTKGHGIGKQGVHSGGAGLRITMKIVEVVNARMHGRRNHKDLRNRNVTLMKKLTFGKRCSRTQNQKAKARTMDKVRTNVKVRTKIEVCFKVKDKRNKAKVKVNHRKNKKQKEHLYKWQLKHYQSISFLTQM
jgi:hypothetical protein